MGQTVAVAGGGIVGLATALALEERGLSVLVLEAEEKIAAHQTGHNSGVVHSGLYYRPGTRKAANCVAGRRALYGFCADHGVAYERCGQLVVATTARALPPPANTSVRAAASRPKKYRTFPLAANVTFTNRRKVPAGSTVIISFSSLPTISSTPWRTAAPVIKAWVVEIVESPSLSAMVMVMT